MTEADWCEGCSQAHNCRKVYQDIGKTEGPSVALKAVIAFVLPVVLFVAALGAFGRLLQHVVASPYQPLCASVLALVATVVLMLIVSLCAKRLDRKRC